MDDAKPSWLEDPRLARRFARVTWFVLVATFVLLTRFDFGATMEQALLAVLIVVVGVLNAPVVVGLGKSREHSHTRAFRLVVLALVMRLAATAWVVWIVGS